MDGLTTLLPEDTGAGVGGGGTVFPSGPRPHGVVRGSTAVLVVRGSIAGVRTEQTS
ncbi:hypothetical protein ACIOJD_10415 [Streptomyces sp. NPDC088116]|uniref:hypothetical protein n=1 Tax=Streptomyces sp. NPDC088116 TaxID=3365825 RepID=UPI003826C409